MKKSKSIYYELSDFGGKFVPSVMVFNGGEVNVSLNPMSRKDEAGLINTTTVYITAKLKSSNDLMELLLVTDALRNRFPTSEIALELAYTPYARQDRVCNSGEALSAKVFANLINAQNYAFVYTIDNHSDVMTALINKCDNIQVYELIEELMEIPEDIVLISPDAGSNKKVLEVSKALGGRTIVRADKVRDTKTGEITETIVYADDFELVGKSCLIVDDICDGGRTFIELAKVLKAKGATAVTLWVTHGIFSKGIQPLLDSGIDWIYTTDSFYEGESGSHITVYEV